jgi:hypothetical protein
MTIEYVSGWRDLDEVARKIREVLTRQLAVVPRWQEVPEAEREAALEHASNNLAQVWPTLGEVSNQRDCTTCTARRLGCVCVDRLAGCANWTDQDPRRAPTAEHAAVRRV